MFCSGQSHRRLLELHEQYGSVVRIGPNELSYTAPEAWSAINGKQTRVIENPKAPWFCPPDGKHIAGAPYHDHVRMRRILANGFSARTMKQQQPIVMGHIDMLIKRLHEKAKNSEAAIEIGSWLNYCAFDIIGDLAFGEPFGCLQDSAMHPWIATIFASLRTGAIGAALKRFPLLPAILPLLVPKKLLRLGEELKRFSHDKVSKRLESGSSRPDILETMTSGKGDMTLTRDEIDNNAFVITVAGSETTATALTGAIYLLAKNPSAMAKLSHEVRSHFADEKTMDFATVSTLPYLCAVVEESLRLYPPGPNAQPRITPPEGNLILGEYIPGNTVIGIPQLATYLSESNFKRAKEFIPERWLEDAEFSGDQKNCFNPFSLGPRNCIGINLAYAELRVILCRMTWNFEWRLAEDCQNWMEKQTSYLHWDKTPLDIHLFRR